MAAVGEQMKHVVMAEVLGVRVTTQVLEMWAVQCTDESNGR